METVIAICTGLGLSAACGFRVFVPLFLISLLGYNQSLSLSPQFAWMASWPAMLAFGCATLFEIGAYYIPWLDNFLDTLTSPASVVAGTLVSASVFVDMDPGLKWSLALIAGGGSAALTQGTTVLTRVLSTLGTGGMANPIVSTIEAILSVIFSIMALLFPILITVGLLGVILFLGVQIKNYRSKDAKNPSG